MSGGEGAWNGHTQDSTNSSRNTGGQGTKVDDSSLCVYVGEGEGRGRGRVPKDILNSEIILV